MIILYILLAVIVLIAAVLMINIRLSIRYGEECFVKIGALFFDYKLTGRQKRKTTSKKKKSSSSKTSSKTSKKSILSEFTDGLEFSDFIELLKLLIDRMIETSSGHLKVKIHKFEVIVGDKYPDTAALKFGAVNTAVALFLEYLRENTQLSPLENSCFFVRCDFEKEQTEAEVNIIAKIKIVHLLKFAIKFFFDFIKLKESKNNISLKGIK